MTTGDCIIALFCEVDAHMPGIPKHPRATLWPSEVVTLGLLHALKGVGNRALYRWLMQDSRGFFPRLPERTRLCRLFIASSLPILGKGEQFPGVICIPTSLCSHYKIRLYCNLSLIKFHKYITIVATMYLDTSRITRGGKTSTRHLLRESYRANGKVLHRTIAHVSHGAEAEIDALRLALRHKEDLEHLGTIQDALTLKQGRSFGAVWTVYHVARRLGIAQALGTTRAGKLALWHVIARGIDQGSRLAAVRLAMAHAACDVLGLGSFDAAALYEHLDGLAGAQALGEDRLCAQRTKPKPITLFLSAVTRSSWEGTHNALAAFGSNRDGKKGQMPMVIGFLCDEDGQPVSSAVLPGHTQAPHTVAAQVEKLKGRFGVTALPCVGDRGLLTSQQVADLAQHGFHDMTAMTKPQMDQLLRTGTLHMDLCDQEL